MNSNNQQIIIDEINEIFESRNDKFIPNYLQVREIYKNPYKMPEFDPLRNEISLCLILGFNQAAMTLTNHLLETFLKIVLIYRESKGRINNEEQKIGIEAFVNDLKPANEHYNDKDLDYTINRAYSLTLITKEQKKVLHDFRVNFRNAYGHADRKKMYGENEIPVQSSRIEDGRFVIDPESSQKIFDIPIFQGIAQVHHSEANAFPYFSYLDNVIRETLDKLFPSISDDINESSTDL